MGSLVSRIQIMFKAVRELGLGQLTAYGLYRLGLRSGYFHWATRPPTQDATHGRQKYRFQPVLELPDREQLLLNLGEEGLRQLLKSADEIVTGQFHLFGDRLVALDLNPPKPLVHWSLYEQAEMASTELDVKLVWEAARLGWVFYLGRAYFLTSDERYTTAFWDQMEIFWEANPAYMGLNWSSAQEVALRILAMAFAGQMFSSSARSTPERMDRLVASIATHACRIPPTLIYARAQNNNHLLSEAVGLVTAALAIPDHPQAKDWYRLGWRWFNRGIQVQIDTDGAYSQHSTNYQRLMLQLALWLNAMVQMERVVFPAQTREKLEAATRWLARLVDPVSGRVPNLGPNDGAYILPMTICPYEDYRPVLAAASLAFLGKRNTEAGLWDEMSLWLVPNAQVEMRSAQLVNQQKTTTPHVLEHPQSKSWIYLRAANFKSRPGHADQLHLDLWWRGLNLAQDAGSYRYNAPKPWKNALTRTAIHNTLMVNGQDQMIPAGRFLWLGWAQASVLPTDEKSSQTPAQIVAKHDGYRRFGLTHQRSVRAADGEGWIVRDRLLFTDPKLAVRYLPFTARLQWLLPDLPWQIEKAENNVEISIQSSYGKVLLSVQEPDQAGEGELISALVVRAGERLYGAGEADPTWGWTSPTYGKKVPALSFSVTVRTNQPMTLVSTWKFP